MPEDVADLAPDVLRHRLVLTYDALADGVTPDDVLGAVLEPVPARTGGGGRGVSLRARGPPRAARTAPRVASGRRQGPGPIAGGLVEALDLVLARRAGGVLPGERRAPGLGAGTELAQLRPYQLGDDVRRLDAAASARTGVPHVREHVPERTLTTWLLLDVSPRWRSARPIG